MEHLIGDGQLRLRMGAAAAERVKNEFVWPKLAEKYDLLYHQLTT
jgi:glycosyltransferase involved in cell wall biosynthesis